MSASDWSLPGGDRLERTGVFAASILSLLVGLLLSFVAAMWSYELKQDESYLLFERRADRLTTEIQRRIELPGYGLKGARGLFMASEEITRAEFRAYVASRDLKQEFHGAIGFGLVERVQRDGLEAFIARERADEQPDFNVFPPGDSEDLYVLKFIEPLERNRSALGYDIASEATRRQTIEQAVSTGKPTISGRLDLVQDNMELPGILYMLPFYKKGTNPQTPEERVRDFWGILDAPIIIEYAFANIVHFTENMVRFDVFDGRAADQGEQLFDFKNHRNAVTGLSKSDGAHAGSYAKVQELVVGGRNWTIHMESTDQFDSQVNSLESILIGAVGMALSLMVSAVMWSLGHSRVRALRLAGDMTRDLAEAKARADAANKSKSEFLANMSHEIRTPLTAILGYATILRDEVDLKQAPPKRVEAVHTIVRGGEHLLQIINDILDLSKIEAGRIQIESIDTPLANILADIEGLMRPRALENGVSMQTVCRTPIPNRIMGDPTRLRQILMNLVGNAVKFTNRGAIQVSVARGRDSWGPNLNFEIEDTGPGMTPEQTECLFKPFSQADGSVTRKHGGTGLGLTISRRLAESMGGDVRLLRTKPGEGTVFVFTMPLKEAPGALAVESVSSEAVDLAENGPSRDEESFAMKGRVLLAEDNPVNQKLIQFHLKKGGAEVVLADNGRIALNILLAEELAGRPFCLLLTDMQMPEMDGYTLARTLRDRGHTIPIIALTAHAMAEDRQKCIDAGCNDYITKPIDRVQLLETCTRWCGRT